MQLLRMGIYYVKISYWHLVAILESCTFLKLLETSIEF